MKRLSFVFLPSVAIALLVCSCGKKETPVATPAAPPPAVTVEGSASPAPAPAPPPPQLAPGAEAAGEPVKEIVDVDPVTKQQRQDLEFMNRSLQAFVTRYQRLPNDFNEFARNIDGVPLPPPGNFWMIDAATKSVKLGSKK